MPGGTGIGGGEYGAGITGSSYLFGAVRRECNTLELPAAFTSSLLFFLRYVVQGPTLSGGRLCLDEEAEEKSRDYQQ